MKVFAIDLSVCNGCYCCQIACKDEHVANDWTPYAKPQPDTGQFWLGLTEQVRGQVPKVKVYDKAAPSQRPVVVPTPEMQRTRDRAAPAPVR